MTATTYRRLAIACGFIAAVFTLVPLWWWAIRGLSYAVGFAAGATVLLAVMSAIGLGALSVEATR